MSASITRTVVVPMVALLALVCGCSAEGAAPEASEAEKSTSPTPAKVPSPTESPVVAATGPHHLQELGEALSRDGLAALKSFRTTWPDHPQQVVRDSTDQIACEAGGERIEFEAEGSIDPAETRDIFPLGLLVGLGQMDYKSDKSTSEVEAENPAVFVNTKDGLTFTLTVDRTTTGYQLFGETACVQ